MIFTGDNHLRDREKVVSKPHKCTHLEYRNFSIKQSIVICLLAVGIGYVSHVLASENTPLASTMPSGSGKKQEILASDAEVDASLKRLESFVVSFDRTSCLWLIRPCADDTKKKPEELVKQVKVRLQDLRDNEVSQKVDVSEAMFACLARSAIALSEISSRTKKPCLSERCRVLNISLDLLLERGRGPVMGIGVHLSQMVRSNPKNFRIRELMAKYLFAQRRNFLTHAILYQRICSNMDDKWLSTVKRQSNKKLLEGLEKIYRASGDGVSRAMVAIYLIEAILLDTVDVVYPERARMLLQKHRATWKGNKTLHLLAKKRIGMFLSGMGKLPRLSVVLMDGKRLKNADLLGKVTLIVFFPSDNVEHFELVSKNAMKLTSGKVLILGVPVGPKKVLTSKGKGVLVNVQKTDIGHLMTIFNMRAVPWYGIVTPKLEIIGGHNPAKASEYLKKKYKGSPLSLPKPPSDRDAR